MRGWLVARTTGDPPCPSPPRTRERDVGATHTAEPSPPKPTRGPQNTACRSTPHPEKLAEGPNRSTALAGHAHWLIADDARTRRRRRALACRRVSWRRVLERSSERIGDTLLDPNAHDFFPLICYQISPIPNQSINPIPNHPPALALCNNQILSRASASLAAAAVSPLRIAPQYSRKVTKSSRPDASLGLPSTAAKRPRTSSAHTCGVVHTPPAPIPAARLAAAAPPPPPPAAGVGAASWGASSAATEVTRTVVRQVVSSRRAKPSAEPTVWEASGSPLGALRWWCMGVIGCRGGQVTSTGVEADRSRALRASCRRMRPRPGPSPRQRQRHART